MGLVVPSVLPRRAEILLGALSRLFCLTKSSIRSCAPSAYPFPVLERCGRFTRCVAIGKPHINRKRCFEPLYKAIPAIVSNMKSSVVMVSIVSIWDFIFMLLGLDLFLYIVGRIPTMLQSAPYHLVSELSDSASLQAPPRTSPYLNPSLGASKSWLEFVSDIETCSRIEGSKGAAMWGS